MDSVSVGMPIKQAAFPGILQVGAEGGVVFKAGDCLVESAGMRQNVFVLQLGWKNLQARCGVREEKASGDPNVKMPLAQATGEQQACDVQAVASLGIDPGQCGIVIHGRP